MKTSELSVNDNPATISRLIKDFFHPYEQWGRLNRSQFITGITCTAAYFLTNIFSGLNYRGFDSFANSSNGLIASVIICWALVLGRFVSGIFNKKVSFAPWYERYMPLIITLLGLVTLIALQNLNNSGSQDAALWINIIILLVIFIITAGYFVEGSSNERVIKMWFALLGYYFSVITFFYFCETLIFKS
ncbi:hypothetical protein EHM76_01680 [bacterium]|nr:MAG: hypothetical protein EHM76_01680 [bacterium]